jgi:hypothetical protein
MISKTYYKYIWLLDTLLTSHPLTIDEINMLWEDCPASDGPIPLRTFHEHRKGIKEMFGVDIECDRSKNVYYVKNPEVIEKNKLAKWLLNKYSIPKEFVSFNGLKDRILLEEIPLGQAFLDPIMEAMLHNLELKIEYQQYKVDQRQEFHMQPYALKVFNRRWYLLGYLKEQEGLRTIALDRILDLKVFANSFKLPEDFDVRKYFADVVGVFMNEGLPITKVKIRAYGVHAEYLRSTPLHKSQSECRSKHGEFAEFTYRLCITPDLESQLLAMGENVEVLEPMELREEMKKRINEMFNFYK